PCSRSWKYSLAALARSPPRLPPALSRAPENLFFLQAETCELYHHAMSIPEGERLKGIRRFLERIHAVMNAIDATPFVTIAAVHGACFGGGLELALACDIIVADKMARFAFPELRLGFIPGFGGVPRLKRDLGNAVVRDLLFTGRTINATRAHTVRSEEHTSELQSR